MQEEIRLNELYNIASKHSNYQEIAPRLKKYIDTAEYQIVTRQEKARMTYISSRVNFDEKYVMDIGGNTGYFTFEAVENGARKVDYVEGNKNHADFVELASKVANISDKINVTNKYYTFDDSSAEYDITFLLNVLHHIGDDYGDNKTSIIEAKKTIIRQLNNMSYKTKVLAFQLGYNWKGNRNACLFDAGTKHEMLEYIKKGIIDYWDILDIGVAESIDGEIVYKDLSDKNIERVDSLGEFSNRPLILLKSLRK